MGLWGNRAIGNGQEGSLHYTGDVCLPWNTKIKIMANTIHAPNMLRRIIVISSTI